MTPVPPQLPITFVLAIATSTESAMGHELTPSMQRCVQAGSLGRLLAERILDAMAKRKG